MRDRIIKLSEMNFEKLNVITLTESGGLMGEIVVIKKGHKHKKDIMVLYPYGGTDFGSFMLFVV